MKLVFDIVPVPASRPRVMRWGVYYQKTYLQFREDMDKLLLGYRGNLIAKPIRTDVTFWMPFPASYSKKKRSELIGKYYVGVCDLDNLEKAIYDSLNGVVWADDKQVVEHSTRKKWAEGRGNIEMNIETI